MEFIKDYIFYPRKLHESEGQFFHQLSKLERLGQFGRLILVASEII